MPRADLSPDRPINGRCAAHRKNGEQCKRAAVRGARVCSTHGGAAPQVKRAAAVRLAMAADWLMAELLRIARSSADERTRLNAVTAALDRAGFGTRTAVDVEIGLQPLKPFEQTLQAATAARIQRLSPEDDDHPAEAESQADIVDAVVVEDPQPLGETNGNVVDLPVRSGREADFRQQQFAMLSQNDLQRGKRGPRPKSRGERNNPTNWE